MKVLTTLAVLALIWAVVWAGHPVQKSIGGEITLSPGDPPDTVLFGGPMQFLAFKTSGACSIRAWVDPEGTRFPVAIDTSHAWPAEANETGSFFEPWDGMIVWPVSSGLFVYRVEL